MNVKNIVLEIKKYKGGKTIVEEIVEEIIKYKDNKNIRQNTKDANYKNCYTDPNYEYIETDDDVNLSHLWIKLNDILIEQNKEIIKNLKRNQDIKLTVINEFDFKIFEVEGTFVKCKNGNIIIKRPDRFEYSYTIANILSIDE